MGYYSVVEKVVKFLLPNLIFVQSLIEKQNLENIGCNVKLIPSGVDLNKFNPVSERTKTVSRRKHNVKPTDSLLLHVGHMNLHRNTQILKEIKRLLGVEVILVAPPSGSHNLILLKELKECGVRVIIEYVENIQEIYQLSDCYVFPAEHRSSAIGFPLSILEAMACNICIITTKFEALPEFLFEGDGFLFVDNSEEIIDKIGEVREIQYVNTRKKASDFSWSSIAHLVLTKTKEICEVDRLQSDNEEREN